MAKPCLKYPLCNRLSGMLPHIARALMRRPLWIECEFLHTYEIFYPKDRQIHIPYRAILFVIEQTGGPSFLKVTLSCERHNALILSLVPEERPWCSMTSVLWAARVF